MAKTGEVLITPVARGANLRDTVKLAVRGAIMSGEMTPGVLYSAPALGAKFGVSPTPVREAMLDLVNEGLVTTEPNRGFRVTEVSEADLDHITQLRLLIEPPVVRDVTAVIPDEDFPELHELAESIVHWAKVGNLAEYTEADRVFHLRLLEYAGNPRIVELVSSLRSQTRQFGLLPLVEAGTLARSAEEHTELVTLMKQRRAAEAESLMRKHISHVRGIWAGANEDLPPE